MKYLYIPTTTLNINNILSTGSISPAAVYAKRRFGYSKFEVVPPNPFQNVLLLYDRYPVFSIVDADRDNHPLVIRIRADRIYDGYQSVQSINVYDKTIYLDPVSTEFLFANLDARRIALIKAEPSFTTKLIDLYQPRMLVADPTLFESFKWNGEMLDTLSDGTSETVLRNCENDLRINRLKGFATGYILGAYKSIDEKVARYRSVLKEQRNEISAMLNDPSKKYSDTLTLALESCLVLDKFWTKEKIGDRQFDHELGDKIVNDRGQIDALIDRHESDPQSTLLLRRFFNAYCINCEFVAQLDEARFNVALEGAKAIKNLLGREWEDSSCQTYINDLLNNVKSGSSFEFYSSNSLILQSFAAFVLKGDDLDKLEAYLVDQGIGDFRIAFALWGAMFGFSKIPKTFYNLPELSYRIKMHNYVHSVVHGIPLRDLEYEVPRVPISQHPITRITKVQPTSHPLEWGEAFQKQLPGAVHWLPSLSELWESCGNIYDVFIEKLDKAKSSSLGGRLKKGTHKDDVVNFFKGVSHVQPEFAEQLTPLTNEERTLKFWDDPDAWEMIRNDVSSVYQNDIRIDLKWFQKNWIDPNSDYYGWKNKNSKSRISDKSLEQRTNVDAIEYFVRFLKNTRNRRLKENREFITEAEIEKIRCLLSKKYF